MTSIGYLGPEGSHSHEALLALLPKLGLSNAQLVPCPTLRRIGKSLHEGTLDAALMPVENALEGSIGETLETVFLHDNNAVLPVLAEVAWPVAHALITKKATSTPIRHIISHPQALAQCRETLIALYGDELVFHTATSTAEAVSLLANQPNTWAALGTQQAAKNTGCVVLNPNVSDSPDNATRFWLIRPHTGSVQWQHSLSQSLHTEKNTSSTLKTSLCIGLVDRPGVLVDALLVLKAYGVTMTRIESRPARSRLGEYLFFIDVACDLNAPGFERVRLFLQSDATLWRLSPAFAVIH